MPQQEKRIAVLGSTGSIGRSALEVIEASEGTLCAVALSARRNVELLAEQCRKLQPRWAIVADPEAAKRLDRSQLPRETELLVGQDALLKIAAEPDVDIVLSAIVGSAGLQSTLAALEAGKTVALANKESLVAGGALVNRAAQENGGRILPVDSEHSAVFQCLQAGRRDELKKVILTASGGPFRTRSLEELADVTVEEALDHPTWNMGPKVTIDSATLMNKALEIIEARWLFDLREDQIGAVLHPQSIVHSLVEFIDGSVIAQMSPPDMRLPIQYALDWPERREGVARRFDWTRDHRLDFETPDLDRFDALALGMETARNGGTCGVVLNAANETAVEAFLERRLGFHEIVPTCRSIMNCHEFEENPSLDRLLQLDLWARREVMRCIHAD